MDLEVILVWHRTSNDTLHDFVQNAAPAIMDIRTRRNYTFYITKKTLIDTLKK